MYQFHGPIVRPPTDAYSVFIETTVGCTHNSCTFCNFYDGFPFRVISFDQIEAQLEEAHRRTPNPRRVWLSGGNPFALSAKKLVELGELVRDYFPKAHVSTYARVDDINRKTVEELEQIKEAGIDDVLVGVETADPVVLEAVNKGYGYDDIIDAFTKLDESGLLWRVIYLGGLAGAGKLEASAKFTADVLNRFHPYLMYLTTVAVLPGTELVAQARRGEFEEASEVERLKEFRTMIAELKNPIGIYANTSTNSVSFTAELPKDKERIIHELDNVIDQWNSKDERAIKRQRAALRTV